MVEGKRPGLCAFEEWGTALRGTWAEVGMKTGERALVADGGNGWR